MDLIRVKKMIADSDVAGAAVTPDQARLAYRVLVAAIIGGAGAFLLLWWLGW